MQNFIKLSAAVHELSCAQGNKKNSAENNTVVDTARTVISRVTSK